MSDSVATSGSFEYLQPASMRHRNLPAAISAPAVTPIAKSSVAKLSIAEPWRVARPRHGARLTCRTRRVVRRALRPRLAVTERRDRRLDLTSALHRTALLPQLAE